MAVTYISDSNPDKVLFLDQVVDLTVTTTCRVVIKTITDNNSFGVTLMDRTLAANTTIALAEMARSLPMMTVSGGSGEPLVDITRPHLTISVEAFSGGSTVYQRTFCIMRGAVTNPNAAKSYILTRHKSPITIYRWSKILLSVITPKPNSGTSNVCDLRLRVTSTGSYSDYLKNTSLRPSGYNDLPNLIRLDESQIRTIFSPTSISGQITRIRLDVYSSTNQAGTNELQFVVGNSRENYREFIFRNSFGAIDFVHSRGEIKLVPEVELSNYQSEFNRYENNAKALKKISVNSGRFASIAERNLWMDFISSDFHSIVDQTGTMHRIIIDKIDAKVALRDNGYITFEYHLANDDWYAAQIEA